MSNPTPRRPVPNTSNASPRRLNDNSAGRPTSSTSSVSAGVGAGPARTPSFRQARPPRRSGARMSTSFADSEIENDEETDSRAELTSRVEQERQRAEQAEQEAAQLRKELQVMRSRNDVLANEQTLLEERDLQRKTEIDQLKAKVQEADRQTREVNTANQSDARLWSQEKESMDRRESDSQSTIKRLHETIRSLGLEKSNAKRATSMEMPISDNSYGSPPLASTTSDVEVDLKEKDSIIEKLTMQLMEQEVAGAQARQMTDSDNRSLQKAYMDLQVKNAELTEENNYFTMMLEKKMLKGDGPDFASEPQETAGLTSLAEEMDFEDMPEQNVEAIKRLEAENKQLREQGKGMTLYIDKIVGRILQNPGYEHIIVGQDDDEMPPPPPAKPGSASADKALPAPPGQDNAGTVGSAMAGFLQRTKSVVSRSNAGRPARPMSYAQPPPTANENPQTAPSIPLNRGHRRARSDQAAQAAQAAQASQPDLGAAALVQHMNRASPLRTVSGGPLSPGISPLSPQLSGKPSYFPVPSQASNRTPSASQQTGGKSSSRNSVNSDISQERSSTDAGSAQTGAPTPSQGPVLPAGVMKQNQLRPLRLVQAQSQEDDDARKRANRGSWMGWFKGSTLEAQNDENAR